MELIIDKVLKLMYHKSVQFTIQSIISYFLIIFLFIQTHFAYLATLDHHLLCTQFLEAQKSLGNLVLLSKYC